MTFQTQRLKTTAPTITTMLMIRPIGLRHSFGFASLVADAGADVGCGSCMGAVGEVVGLSMEISVFETDEPHGQRPHDHHANVNKSLESHVRIELETNQQLTRDDGKGETDENAQHPGGKIGAKNVNSWRMCAQAAALRWQRHERKSES